MNKEINNHNISVICIFKEMDSLVGAVCVKEKITGLYQGRKKRLSAITCWA